VKEVREGVLKVKAVRRGDHPEFTSPFHKNSISLNFNFQTIIKRNRYVQKASSSLLFGVPPKNVDKSESFAIGAPAPFGSCWDNRFLYNGANFFFVISALDLRTIKKVKGSSAEIIRCRKALD